MSIKILPQTGMCNSNADVACCLHEQADWIGKGDYGDVRNVYLVIENMDGQLQRRTAGQPCDLARAIGVLHIAAARAATGD